MTIQQVIKEASLLYCLPSNPFFRTVPTVADPSVEVPEGGLGYAVQEATYACETTFVDEFLGLTWAIFRCWMDIRTTLL